MNIIRIGNEAMKISLCTDEATKLGFSIDESEEKMKDSFIKLLIKAKEEIEYAVLDKKIVGEIFSGKDGGCEIFVSRVEARDRVYSDRISYEHIKKSTGVSSIFMFESLDTLLDVTRRLDEISYGGTSSVYYDEEQKKYYIILEDVSVKELKYAFITEYSKQVQGINAQLIKEHCKCICKKNGVKILSKC